MAIVYQFTVGDISCAALHEGGSTIDIAGLKGRHPDVSEDELSAALGGKTETINSLNCLYIDANGTKILADTGFGAVRRPPMGNVEPALASIGVQPEDINIVYLTHFHGDHIIGLHNAEGQPTYPNARYVTSNAEWAEWMERWEQSEQEAHKNLLQMIKSLVDKFSFVDDGDEVVPGVKAVLAPGHTLGQTGLLVESNGEGFIHNADVLHQPFQFAHPEWHVSFDSDKPLAAETRRNVLERCANENLLAMFYHLPFPGVGRVARDGDVYRWQPVEFSAED
jgi:glyoxylase-like metal-dependent hydrolase (beta-lactamase superfamily II)